jgi:Zn-dependent oligopeptidase
VAKSAAQTPTQRRIAAGAVENDALVKLEYSKQDRIRAAENSARSENLKGIAAIVEAEREQIDEIRVLRERGEIDDEEFSKREVEINKRTKKQIIESERQTAQTLRQFHEDTVQAQERAAVAALPEWKRANAQITVDAQDRIRQIDEAEKELLRNVAANSDEYERITRDAQARREAVWSETNSRIADEHKQMVRSWPIILSRGSMTSPAATS